MTTPIPEDSSDTTSDGEDSGPDLPATLRELTRVRREAAGYKSKVESMEAELANRLPADQVANAVAEEQAKIKAQTRAMMVENAALRFRLPDDLAQLLRGETRQELMADAKKLAKYVPLSDDDDRDDDDNFDPRAVAQEMRGKRYQGGNPMGADL